MIIPYSRQSPPKWDKPHGRPIEVYRIVMSPAMLEAHGPLGDTLRLLHLLDAVVGRSFGLGDPEHEVLAWIGMVERWAEENKKGILAIWDRLLEMNPERHERAAHLLWIGDYMGFDQ